MTGKELWEPSQYINFILLTINLVRTVRLKSPENKNKLRTI